MAETQPMYLQLECSIAAIHKAVLVILTVSLTVCDFYFLFFIYGRPM